MRWLFVLTVGVIAVGLTCAVAWFFLTIILVPFFSIVLSL